MKKLSQRSILILCFLVTIFHIDTSALPNVIRSIQSFGAVGDGNTLDDNAFIKAALFFNNRDANGKQVNNVNYAAGQKAELILDYYKAGSKSVAAIYLVGKQIGPGESIILSETGGTKLNPEPTDAKGGYNYNCFLRRGNDIFTIASNVNGLYIHSSWKGHKVKIKYVDNMYYGAWCPPNYQYKCFKQTCDQSESCFTQVPADSKHPNKLYIPYKHQSDNYGYGCSTCPPPASNNCRCGTASNPGMAIPVSVPQGDLNNLSNANIAELPSAMNVAGLINDWKTQCMVGTFFVIKGANVTLEDIELDGNNTKCKFGRWVNDWGGIQLPYSGIAVYAAGANPVLLNTIIRNVDAHHFGLDGLVIYGNSDLTTLSYCKFEYNIRQGISWTGGSHVKADHVDCNYSGTAKNIHSGLNMGGNPGAGMDIEVDLPGIPCIHGTFDDCNFIGNGGSALANDQYNSDYVSSDVSFNRCVFHDVTGDGIRVRGDHFTFTDCDIWALSDVGYKGTDATKGTKFIGCRFEDKALKDSINRYVFPLIFSRNANSMLFDHCSFKVNDANRELANVTEEPVSLRPSSEWPVFKDCVFENNNVGKRFDYHDAAVFQNVRFRNANKFKYGRQEICKKHVIRMDNVIIEGNEDICQPGKLDIDGHYEWQILLNVEMGQSLTGKDAYHVCNLLHGALLMCRSDIASPFKLTIGPKAKVNIHPTSGLVKCEVNLLGQLNIFPGAFIHQNGNGSQTRSISGNSQSKLFISRWANQGSSIPAFWLDKSCPIVNFTAVHFINGVANGPVNGVAKQDESSLTSGTGLPAMTSNSCSNDLFDMVYSVEKVRGNNGNKGRVNMMICGGVSNQSNYTYSINGGKNLPFAKSTMLLNPGKYKIVVKDALRCKGMTNSFNVQISK